MEHPVEIAIGAQLAKLIKYSLLSTFLKNLTKPEVYGTQWESISRLLSFVDLGNELAKHETPTSYPCLPEGRLGWYND